MLVAPGWVMLLLVAALLFPMPAGAHEGHRNNQPDPSAEEALVEPNFTELGIDTSAPDEETALPRAIDAQSTFDPVDFLGRLHPAIVHFPIALLIAAAFAEFLLILRPDLGLRTTVRFLAVGGAAGAVFAALLGWFAGGFRFGDRSDLLGWHRWTGTGIAVAALVIAILSKNKDNRVTLRALLAGTALALMFQGYWGGELSLGPDHLGLNPDQPASIIHTSSLSIGVHP